jgi:peptidoglycan hydrolase-like protein with peptidoglycan-binding domain
MWLVASTLVLFGLVIAPAASAVAAPAADPECNYGTWVHEGAFQQFFPSHHVGNAHNFRCELREGDFNNFGVVALQNTLIRCYGQAIAPDSDFGPKTEAALKNAQRIHGLPATGVYNWTTHITIFWPTYLAGADIDDKFKCQASF